MRAACLLLVAACAAGTQAPPPPALLTLSVDRLVEGRVATFTATGARPGATVWVVASAELDPTAPSACPPSLPVCLRLTEPVLRVGAAVADGSGTADVEAVVPVGAGVRTGAFQAVSRQRQSDVLTADVARVDPSTSIVLVSDMGNATRFQTIDLGVSPPVVHVDTFGVPASVRAASDGPGGWVYAQAFGGAMSRLDPLTGALEDVSLGGAPGSRVDLTDLPGDGRIFMLREVNGDRLATWDPVTGVQDTSFMTLGGAFDSPRALTDGPDGLLWAIDSVGVLMSLDVGVRVRTVVEDFDAPGTYQDLTSVRGSGLLYILRDTGGSSAIDTYDPVTATYTTDVVALPGIATDGQRNVLSDLNDGRLVVAGEPEVVLVDLDTLVVTSLPTAVGGAIMGVTSLRSP